MHAKAQGRQEKHCALAPLRAISLIGNTRGKN